jgi:predicted metal-dependent peptidase
MKDKPPRMEKTSKLRRSAQRQLPTALVKHRRELQAAIDQSKKRPPREVQRALKQAAKQARRNRQATLKQAIEAQYSGIVITEIPIPKPQEAAASQTAGDQSDG